MLRWLLIFGLACPAFADLRIVTKRTFGQRTLNQTEFYKGDLARFDTDSVITILDNSRGLVTSLDPAKHEFSQTSNHGTVARLGRPLQIDKSRIVIVEVETHDTGEQRQVWGHVAHRYLTLRRQHEEGADATRGNVGESTTESWYLDTARPAAYRHQGLATLVSFSLTSGKSSQPEVRVISQGDRPDGVLIYQKTEGSIMEVTDLSDGSLDANLFVIPSGFHRVARVTPSQTLSWDEQIQFYWQQMEDWFSRLLS